MELSAPGLDAPAEASFLSFTVGTETCAVDLAAVQEIVRVPAIVGVPLSPPAVEGLINLRGRVLPVINARRTLGFGDGVSGEQARIVVLHRSALYGLLVDAVAGVVTGEPEPLQAAQESNARDMLSGTLHAGGKVIMVIDQKRLLGRNLAALPTAEATPGFGESRAETVMEADDEGFRYLTFLVAGQEYGLPVEQVREIGRLPDELGRVPHAANHLLGIAPLRGRLLPFVDMRDLLGLADQASAGKRRVLVLAAPGSAPVGLVVDDVREVLHAMQEPEALPPLWERPEDAELQGMLSIEGGKRLVAVLAAERLLQPILSQMATEDTAMAEDEAPKDVDEDRSDTETLVVFLLDRQEFGLPVSAVREILRVPEQLARVPGAADFVEGMVNLRGQVLSVLDQRRRLGMAGKERSHRQRILVLEAAGNVAGFAVDEVSEVLDVPLTSLGPAPATSEAQARVVSRVANLTDGERMILVLDPQELLRGAELPPAAEEMR